MTTSKFKSPEFQFNGQFSTVVIDLPKDFISQTCSAFEGYDNLALVRTVQQGVGRLYIYTNQVNLPLVKEILMDLNRGFPITIAEIEEGTKDLKTNWQV